MKKLVLIPGKSCEDCVFFKKGCGEHQTKRCGNKLFYAYQENGDKTQLKGIKINNSCETCRYYSQIGNYKPHCHYNGTKKPPVIDGNFKCPKTGD